MLTVISILINDDDINYHFYKSKNDIVNYINNFNYTQKFNIFSQDQEEKNINNNNSIIDVMLKETDNKTVYLKDSIKTERDFTNKNFLEGAVLEISMVAKYKVWVEIKNSKGNMIISRIFEKGDKYKFPKGSNYNLSTNDASGLKFYNAEKLLVLAGKSEEILSDININEYLINIK
ncbi:MAG: RodZ domain-containing protein [Alphaproteobacteria bacterium]